MKNEIFRRIEKKYVINKEQYEELIKEISKYDQSIIIPNWIKKDK